MAVREASTVGAGRPLSGVLLHRAQLMRRTGFHLFESEYMLDRIARTRQQQAEREARRAEANVPPDARGTSAYVP